MAKSIYGPQMAKNVYGPPMAINIYGSQRGKNIYGPPMAKNTFNSHYFQYLILENGDKTKVMPRSARASLLALKNCLIFHRNQDNKKTF